MKKIAVVTGASSGMGRDFVRLIEKYESFDEIWAIARRIDRLESLSDECSIPVRAIPLDLTKEDSFAAYKEMLKQQEPNVALLVCCSGYGKFGRYDDIDIADKMGMIDLNCKALVMTTELTLPYMREGSHIIELDSLSAFQPVPYIGVYGATKAFVLSYSR
ncbi:MAG: SDR family NAD(P)-dependent oxidoreductase, partial [Clostridia bacterium]|nr:SDR family NAD(P)-dependent oxidoreductase [Clostridia bacterium]